ncbi:DoxX family protein [Leeia sp.]|uniref:DoxX family protein n=1 Tax=Leeia sp. TaxID=2884678 RepID=UPI0035B35FC7
MFTLGSRFERPEWATLIIRLALGMMYLSHGLMKVIVYSPQGFADFMASLGLPAGVAYLTILAELAGGVLLLSGFLIREVALLLTPILLGSIVLVHAASGWAFSNPGGGWEYPAFLIAASVALFFMPSGRAQKVA